MDLKKYLDKQLENEEFKKEWEEFQPELQLMKQVIGENLEKNIKAMKYAIYSNEIEGHKYTDKEKDFLMSVAEEKISIEEAIKTILNK